MCDKTHIDFLSILSALGSIYNIMEKIRTYNYKFKTGTVKCKIPCSQQYSILRVANGTGNRLQYG